MGTKHFLGYSTDENVKMVINREQFKIVERIYDEYLSSKTLDQIKQTLKGGKGMVRLKKKTF